ncbi:EscU/YscU/HrcU family type III secretion system export apparatus switch protein [Kordiimonas pumila]|uniref:EscU/YscU/HrcU family type III secretion system export apparatus switch protein n=1 Tax=Kordiimonas pumila TaxID=2161677 RepID=A0ABV7D1V2_9PROT|nr:EscU/YscU/HrcU family type III secretion system export apparatus switch protein [Kordiimonas pumila]
MDHKLDNNESLTKAIAIKGDNAGNTPHITAKGEGMVAERILDIAFAEGVKVRQDKDLTELLSAFNVESPVPLEALHVVSLILERVYAENNRLQGQKLATDDKAESTST